MGNDARVGMAERTRARLGRLGEVARPADVAAALNVSARMVLTWIECGAIEAMNLGTAARPYWLVDVGSVLEFCEGRLAGK